MAQQDKQTNYAGSAQAGSGPSVTEGIADSAKQAGSQAKEAAARAFGQLKDEAASRADQQRQTLASGIGAVAEAFRSMSEELKGKEQGPIAEYTAEFGQAIGSQVEKLGTYLDGRDIKQLLGDTEQFARRSPGVFLGTAFVLGVAATRFFKSSSSQSGSSSGQSQPNPATQPPQLALPPAPAPTATAPPVPKYDVSSTPSTPTPSTASTSKPTPSTSPSTTPATSTPSTTTGSPSSTQTVKGGSTTVGGKPSTSGL